ncbi:MAG: cupin domain-containing protein [Rhizobiaceae bacterium]|jgi:quercetin dioxygenase-like cupin family protein|nr:cupin domain-containing protein [Rhizobiaceae bacterium]
MPSKPFVTAAALSAQEGWNEPDGRGVLTWQTLASNDVTPSEALTAGIVHLAPGGFLALHRHPPAEIYHVIEGSAVVTLNGTSQVVTVGDTVYIPPMTEHGIRNTTASLMRFFYVFPTNAFAEVEYQFS